MHATSLLKLSAASFAAVAAFEAAYQGLSLASALAASGEICSTYLSCLFASMVIYRTVFHRLRHFPGPALAKVSKLWHVARCLDSKNHLLLERLHREYGDFVRTGARPPKHSRSTIRKKAKIICSGPNELTIFAPNVLPTILEGPSNPFSKPAWYDSLQPYIGLTNHRNRKVHERHRRVWDHGFTTQGLHHLLCSRLALTFTSSFAVISGSDQGLCSPTRKSYCRQWTKAHFCQ